MVMMPEWYGISDGSLPARISFLSVGIGGLVLHKLLLSPSSNNIFHKESEKDYIFKGLRELKVVLNNLKYLKSLKQFLIAFSL
jgi:UMF1 family MFS transporter